jgi:RNA:NAD 2'-phosphotransferase (TPT1/KptA family)
MDNCRRTSTSKILSYMLRHSDRFEAGSICGKLSSMGWAVVPQSLKISLGNLAIGGRPTAPA